MVYMGLPFLFALYNFVMLLGLSADSPRLDGGGRGQLRFGRPLNERRTAQGAWGAWDGKSIPYVAIYSFLYIYIYINISMYVQL